VPKHRHERHDSRSARDEQQRPSDRAVPDEIPADRTANLEAIADRWAATVAAAQASKLVLNADDPLVADLGRARPDAFYYDATE